ncbi:uncharacterized protein LAESUDRAFT_499794 [Laetiporus sulphureus 93-53]|uniref:Uncharacterized protein n=1 Tax=Laetiporus sulphureus 93-53 TaxID=1314785 RepID=A0A165BFY1_9APHY|nr:uncharacterized protein LAESUDRAFT_499794 [Laetiporus sulphureus 93-53]KZT00975.1 hypothetical protein LAESUDRAFT_499794 [Laetiporus sulphureus 93-53]
MPCRKRAVEVSWKDAQCMVKAVSMSAERVEVKLPRPTCCPSCIPARCLFNEASRFIKTPSNQDTFYVKLRSHIGNEASFHIERLQCNDTPFSVNMPPESRRYTLSDMAPTWQVILRNRTVISLLRRVKLPCTGRNEFENPIITTNTHLAATSTR